MKTSEILIAAKELLASGEVTYVCVAVRSVRYALVRAAPGRSQLLEIDIKHAALRSLIHERIKPQETVRNWLICEVGIPAYEVDNQEALKTYRLAWVDSLIKEYQSLGD